MPIPIIAFVAFLSLSLAGDIWAMIDHPGPKGEGAQLFWLALLLVGVLRHHRLAWQWGQIIGIIGGVALLVLGLMPPGSAILVVNGVAFFAVAILMRRPSAKRWFRLVCPSCDAMKARAANFFFTRARCRGCGAVF